MKAIQWYAADTAARNIIAYGRIVDAPAKPTDSKKGQDYKITYEHRRGLYYAWVKIGRLYHLLDGCTSLEDAKAKGDANLKERGKNG